MTNTPDHALTYENPAVADLRARQKADIRASLSRKECQLIGGWGQTKQIALEGQGVLRRFLNGTSVRVTTQSLYEHLIALASEPPRKARQPATRFAPRRRRKQVAAE